MPKINISVENAEFQIIQALKTNRAKRHKAQEVFVEGIESIKQAASAGLEITRIITPSVDGLSDWAKNLIRQHREATVIEMRAGLYASLCDRDEPSELVITVRINPHTLHDLSLPAKPFVLVFDRPSDMGNLGSIIRSANSFGVDAIFLIGHGVDVYDPKTIRASLGSVFHSTIIHIQSMPEFEAWIKEQKRLNGMSISGTDSTGDVSLMSYKLTKPITVILGNEAKGMSVALKNLCDQIIGIPVEGAVNSLNVASAGSIVLWEVYRNRG